MAVVSNEGRELAEYRVREFGLASFVDFFIFSSFVHFRKPDADIFRLPLDVAEVPANEVVYIEDRPMFVEVARSLGIAGIHHVDCGSTRLVALAGLGLPFAQSCGDAVLPEPRRVPPRVRSRTPKEVGQGKASEGPAVCPAIATCVQPLQAAWTMTSALSSPSAWAESRISPGTPCALTTARQRP